MRRLKRKIYGFINDLMAVSLLEEDLKKHRIQKREFERLYAEVNSALFRISKEDELACIDYLMHLMRVRLSAQGRLNAFYSNDEVVQIFPDKFMSRKAKPINLIKTGDKQAFRLDDETYITTWKKYNLLSAFLEVFRSGGFKQSSNHEAVYYKELGLLHVVNGLHSSSAGVYLGGEIEAEVYSIEPFFDSLLTDGAYWCTFDELNGYHRFKELTVPDFHIAVLFELAKMKHELLKKKVV